MHDKGKGKKGGKDEKVYKGLSGSWQSGKGKGKQFWNYEPKGKGKNRMMRRDVSSARQPFFNERLQNAYGGSGKS